MSISKILIEVEGLKICDILNEMKELKFTCCFNCPSLSGKINEELIMEILDSVLNLNILFLRFYNLEKIKEYIEKSGIPNDNYSGVIQCGYRPKVIFGHKHYNLNDCQTCKQNNESESYNNSHSNCKCQILKNYLGDLLIKLSSYVYKIIFISDNTKPNRLMLIKSLIDSDCLVINPDQQEELLNKMRIIIGEEINLMRVEIRLSHELSKVTS